MNLEELRRPPGPWPLAKRFTALSAMVIFAGHIALGVMMIAYANALAGAAFLLSGLLFEAAAVDSLRSGMDLQRSRYFVPALIASLAGAATFLGAFIQR